MPLTKDKYVVRDNPHLVAWERETRMFLRGLPLTDSHRVSAVHVYEWARAKTVVQAIADGEGPGQDLRKINEVLRYYFGKSYATWMAGKKVPNCYRVPLNWRVKRHRPMTLTLWYEYKEGTLNDDGARRHSA